MPGKRYRDAAKGKPTSSVTVAEAVVYVKEHAKAKFDETVEVHIRLGVNPKMSDQSVRGAVVLPSGAPYAVRVAVFTANAALQDAAKAAGADLVGGKELIDKVA